METMTHSTILSTVDHATRVATLLMADVMRYRRVAGPHGSCATLPCPLCLAPHLEKVVHAITHNQPIEFVLPAFPGKSPNPNKVLGPLPDLAEQLALEFLGHLCQRIRKYHAPGAKVILCSDGRVFSDVIGMREEDVSGYQLEISKMIERLGLGSISTFNLDDLFAGKNFSEMRIELMAQYGKPLGDLKNLVQEDEDTRRLYCGTTRFLVEDAMCPGQTKSRTAIQKDCRARAYEVIQRSNAWSELIHDQFPNAIRLSIHPQVCGAKKLGIRLVGTENWMTPWHGVAVDIGGRFILLKRSQAEALGARVAYTNGRASHFELSAVRYGA